MASAVGLLGSVAAADVWPVAPGREWTAKDLKAYEDFIARKASPDFFKAKGAPFDALKIDCADAVYTWRAYFARENGLPYVIGNGRHSQAMRAFDHIRDPDQRFNAFIQFVAERYGTGSLAANDTFPVAIADIRSGDVFLYKFESAPGSYTRHAYMIKNVNSDGTFDIIYSTQARRDKGEPLRRIQRYSFPNPKWVPSHVNPEDAGKWGFKRFRSAEQAATPEREIPGASFEQYELAKQHGDSFFAYVKQRRAREKETPAAAIRRVLGFVCQELKDRVEHIAATREFLEEQGPACLGPVPYDTHSTPSRDGGILNSYREVLRAAEELKATGRWSSLDADSREIIRIVFGGHGRARSRQELAKARAACDFTAGQTFRTDMASFYDALAAGKVSNHPQDPLELRWGLSSQEPPSACPRY